MGKALWEKWQLSRLLFSVPRNILISHFQTELLSYAKNHRKLSTVQNTWSFNLIVNPSGGITALSWPLICHLLFCVPIHVLSHSSSLSVKWIRLHDILRYGHIALFSSVCSELLFLSVSKTIEHTFPKTYTPSIHFAAVFSNPFFVNSAIFTFSTDIDC